MVEKQPINSSKYLNSLNYLKTQKKIEQNFEKSFYCVYENNHNEILGFSKFGKRKNLELESYHEYDCVTFELKNKEKKKIIRQLNCIKKWVENR